MDKKDFSVKIEKKASKICAILFSPDNKYSTFVMSQIQQYPRLEFTYCHFDPNLLYKETKKLSPKVVIIDIERDTSHLIKIISTIFQSIAAIKIFVISPVADDNVLFSCLRAGASAYYVKNEMHIKKFAFAIEELHNYGASFPPNIAYRLVRSFHPEHAPGKYKSNKLGLTGREKEILDLFLQGFRTKDVANHLEISYETVRTHKKNIYKKANVRSFSQMLTIMPVRLRNQSRI